MHLVQKKQTEARMSKSAFMRALKLPLEYFLSYFCVLINEKGTIGMQGTKKSTCLKIQSLVLDLGRGRGLLRIIRKISLSPALFRPCAVRPLKSKCLRISQKHLNCIQGRQMVFSLLSGLWVSTMWNMFKINIKFFENKLKEWFTGEKTTARKTL